MISTGVKNLLFLGNINVEYCIFDQFIYWKKSSFLNLYLY